MVGVAPGYTETEGNRESAAAFAGYLIDKTPLKRAGQPADIAAAVSFAISDDAGWVTACPFDVAGGLVF